VDGVQPSRRIHVLREDVANRIAAGEVIDRPLSIVRELLDNALDASAHSVDVWIERGGLDEVRVADDGAGMVAEDLELCFLPHATSKIESLEDLARSTSLGFRGEALSSIGVSATLEVTSRPPAARTAHRLLVRDGRRVSLEPCPGAAGTLVRVSGLFEHQPGRRQFLKSAGSESAQCASAFLDKAVAFPGVRFRFHADATLRHFLPEDSIAGRVAAAYPPAAGAGGLELREEEREGCTARIVLARPEASRRDRKLIQVFVNGRRIWEYSLVQAVEYGFAGTVPGGLHPIAFVFLTVDPAQVDFNVHPAKREARFRDLASVHRLVVDVVKGYVRGRAVGAANGVGLLGRREPSAAEAEVRFFTEDAGSFEGRGPAAAALADRAGTYDRLSGPAGDPASPSAVAYLGRIFGVFLVALHGDRVYLVDQHAAHERLIFDRLMRRKPEAQELLMPISLDLDPAERRRLEATRGELEEAGIVVETDASGHAEVTAMDPLLERIPESEVAELVAGRRGEPGSLRRALCALAACSQAVKDGEALDQAAARSLVADALALPEPRCPHGRPIWHSISRDELYKLVKREL
jgi:DNA mismatch repair protein MutL